MAARRPLGRETEAWGPVQPCMKVFVKVCVPEASLLESACGDGAARKLHLRRCCAVGIPAGSGPMLLVRDWRSYKDTGPCTGGGR